jgi:GT2 family glycosyltransferase
LTSPDAPLISVVIPTHQRRASVLRALGALVRQDLPYEMFEVVVSVDGSDDGTREAIAAFDAPYALRTVYGPRRGRAGACNAAIDVARGEIVLILDDDMEPAPSCLRKHGLHHAQQSKLCVIGAVPIEVDGTSPPVVRYVAAKFARHLEKLAEPDHEFVVRDFYSGNASMRRVVLTEIGGFAEEFVLYGNEDIELSLRLRQAGVTFRYDPEALAHQHYGKGLTELASDTYEKGKTAVLLARRHPESFEGLQLARHDAHSVLWRALRATLLAATRSEVGPSSTLIRLARRLERAGGGRRPMFYVLMLDYFYWAGAAAALAEATQQGSLALLAQEIRHGPIHLLLHR